MRALKHPVLLSFQQSSLRCWSSSWGSNCQIYLSHEVNQFLFLGPKFFDFEKIQLPLTLCQVHKFQIVHGKWRGSFALNLMHHYLKIHLTYILCWNVRVWDVRTKAIVRTLETKLPCTSVEVSRDGNYVTTADGNTVKFWDAHQ